MKLGKLKPQLFVPSKENYIKNSSGLVSGLFIIGGLLYFPTQGYATLVALVVALIVMLGQKILLTQINRDFADMYQAKKMFEQSRNPDYLKFINLRSQQILQDNKVLSAKAKTELAQLQDYCQTQALAQSNE